MKKVEAIPPQKRCPVCNHGYDAGRSKCPKCGTPNSLFESETFIKFAIEIEKALFRAVEAQGRKRGEGVEGFIIQAIEERVSRLNMQKRG